MVNYRTLLFWYFSMCRITKIQTMTGLDWSLIKKVPGGLENVGTFMNF